MKYCLQCNEKFEGPRALCEECQENFEELDEIAQEQSSDLAQEKKLEGRRLALLACVAVLCAFIAAFFHQQDQRALFEVFRVIGSLCFAAVIYPWIKDGFLSED